MSYFETARLLASNKDYVQLCLSISGLYFVVSGLTFWGKFYMMHVLMFDEVNSSYFVSFTTLTSIVIGIVVGGVISSSLGGHQSKTSRLFCLYCAWLTVPICIPIPLVSDFMAYGLLQWVLLFLGSVILPQLYENMISCIQQDLRAQGNSFAQLAFNSLGLMPAPAIYGFISMLFDKGIDFSKLHEYS